MTPVSSASASPLTFHDDNADLLSIQYDLMQHDLFLGNAWLLDNVHWMEQDRKHVLVTQRGDSEDPLYEPATLVWVGELDVDDFMAYGYPACNGIHGNCNSQTPFEGAIVTTPVRASKCEFFSDEWPKCLENMQNLVAAASTRTLPVAVDVVEADKIMLSHAVFQV
jgi:hypothetical protein